MPIMFPTGTRDQIEQMINADGRNVTFEIPSVSGCYNCSLDPVTNTSTNAYCPVCSGVYWITTYSGYDVIAHVSWKYSDKNEFNTGGIVPIGDGIIKVIYSGPNVYAAENADYVIVDGKEVNIEKVTLLGVPEINRMILDFKERSR